MSSRHGHGIANLGVCHSQRDLVGRWPLELCSAMLPSLPLPRHSAALQSNHYYQPLKYPTREDYFYSYPCFYNIFFHKSCYKSQNNIVLSAYNTDFGSSLWQNHTMRQHFSIERNKCVERITR